MIAEPYICIKGPKAGTIEWFNEDCPAFVPSPSGINIMLKCRPDSIMDRPEIPEVWQIYSDFEREKLQGIAPDRALCTVGVKGYKLLVPKIGRWICRGEEPQTEYRSSSLIGYSYQDWLNDSESSRLLKRAEFLKAVCEKEGVEWLPPSCCCRQAKDSIRGCGICDPNVRPGPISSQPPDQEGMIQHYNVIQETWEKYFQDNYYTKVEIDGKLKSLHDYCMRQNRIGAELEELYERRIIEDHNWKCRMEIRTSPLLDKPAFIEWIRMNGIASWIRDSLVKSTKKCKNR